MNRIILAILLSFLIAGTCFAWIMDRRTMQMGNQDSVAVAVVEAITEYDVTYQGEQVTYLGEDVTYTH